MARGSGYCAFGVGLWISLQAFVSMGVNLGLLPTKGLTLPLISSGGSSVLMTCAAMGLLLRVSYELDRAERQVAKLRGQSVPAESMANDDAFEEAPRSAAAARLGNAAIMPATRGHRARIEPRLGAQR